MMNQAARQEGRETCCCMKITLASFKWVTRMSTTWVTRVCQPLGLPDQDGVQDGGSLNWLGQFFFLGCSRIATFGKAHGCTAKTEKGEKCKPNRRWSWSQMYVFFGLVWTSPGDHSLLDQWKS
jgi:hypothetical protein